MTGIETVDKSKRYDKEADHAVAGLRVSMVRFVGTLISTFVIVSFNRKVQKAC